MRRVAPLTHQRGVTLIDSLLAVLVLVLGIVGMARLQGHLRLNADISRQRTEALRLAQEDIESLRTFTAVAATPSQTAYDDIVSTSKTVDTSTGYKTNTSFQVDRSVSTAAGFRTASVSVAWDDRTGQQQQVLLQSVIAGTPPALSGALSVQPSGQPLKSVRGRSAFVPWLAKDLGNGSSAFKPASGGTIAFVLDNENGEVTSVCTDIAAATQTSALTLTDLTHCTAIDGLLLSGIVRRSLSASADPVQAGDAPLPLTMALKLGNGDTSAAICTCESVTVPTGDRFVAYHCVVPVAPAGWSGRSTVVPQGWTIGTAAGQHRVCRYSADQDGSGAVDQNAEHPNEYQHVTRNLMQQNFLIVPGEQACPVPAATAPDLATIQHQP